MQSLKGHLLVASPSLVAPIFARTVLLMLDHTEEGAAGLILNRPTETMVTEIAERIFEAPFTWEKPVSLGGPVPGPLMVLHTLEGLGDQESLTCVYNTVETDRVQELIHHRPEPSLVLANYAGWGPGQLESEFGDDSWLYLPATYEHVFWQGEGDLWDVVVKSINASQLSRMLRLKEIPDDPSMN